MRPEHHLMHLPIDFQIDITPQERCILIENDGFFWLFIRKRNVTITLLPNSVNQLFSSDVTRRNLDNFQYEQYSLRWDIDTFIKMQFLERSNKRVFSKLTKGVTNHVRDANSDASAASRNPDTQFCPYFT